MGTLFVGIVNSGLMSAWIFIFLDQEPEWRDKVVAEIRSVMDKYVPVSKGCLTTPERLSKIPPQVWDNEMPVLEVSNYKSSSTRKLTKQCLVKLCLRETIRYVASVLLGSAY